MKKVLIITYYWPPAGGSGVQRWLKFTKYLPQFGWKPIVYTPENPELPVKDESLFKDIPSEAEIIKRKIIEPYSFYKSFIGQKKEEGIKAGFAKEQKASGFKQNMSVWIRGNLFIPDARKYWIRPSVKYLTKYLTENSVDLIVSTGPPHSMHLIALGLKKNHNIPWIADFRDPWTNIDFYQDLKLTRLSDKKHKLLEKKVLQRADRVIAIGKTMQYEFKQLGGRNVDVITNGFDNDDVEFDDYKTSNSDFSLVHIGTLNKTRNFDFFWRTLARFIQNNQTRRINVKLIGSIDYSVKDSVDKYNLGEFVTIIDYVPHSEVIKQMLDASVLLLFVNNTANAKGVLTGKFFEYLSSGIPILTIGPKGGDVDEILSDAKAGELCVYENEEHLYRLFEKYYFLTEESSLKRNNSVLKYSRRELTKKLVETFNELIQ